MKHSEKILLRIFTTLSYVILMFIVNTFICDAIKSDSIEHTADVVSSAIIMFTLALYILVKGDML